jgi:hypothetical protein
MQGGSPRKAKLTEEEKKFREALTVFGKDIVNTVNGICKKILSQEIGLLPDAKDPRREIVGKQRDFVQNLKYDYIGDSHDKNKKIQQKIATIRNNFSRYGSTYKEVLKKEVMKLKKKLEKSALLKPPHTSHKINLDLIFEDEFRIIGEALPSEMSSSDEDDEENNAVVHDNSDEPSSDVSEKVAEQAANVDQTGQKYKKDLDDCNEKLQKLENKLKKLESKKSCNSNAKTQKIPLQDKPTTAIPKPVNLAEENANLSQKPATTKVNYYESDEDLPVFYEIDAENSNDNPVKQREVNVYTQYLAAKKAEEAINKQKEEERKKREAQMPTDPNIINFDEDEDEPFDSHGGRNQKSKRKQKRNAKKTQRRRI